MSLSLRHSLWHQRNTENENHRCAMHPEANVSAWGGFWICWGGRRDASHVIELFCPKPQEPDDLKELHE